MHPVEWSLVFTHYCIILSVGTKESKPMNYSNQKNKNKNKNWAQIQMTQKPWVYYKIAVQDGGIWQVVLSCNYCHEG